MRSIFRGMVALCVLAATGCQQDMANQPRYDTFERSTFFEDGLSARQRVPGTVARHDEVSAAPLYTGKAAGAVVMTLPVPVTADLLARGQEHFNIFCSPCHDRAGTGQGMIVQRGYPRPPSLHIPRLRQAPPGHFFTVISDGYGTMPNYGSLIVPQERWAIVAYMRALQLSQYASVAELPEAMRQQLQD